MHVNWHWIRQRPQVLAEQLAHHHTMHLLHYRMFHRHHRAADSTPLFPAQELQRLPERIKRLGRPMQAFNTAWLSQQFGAAARKFQPDAVWVTHPDFMPALRALPLLPVVYDCMDDHAAFNEAGTEAMLEAERELLARADLVFFSSATLAARVRARATVRRSEVVNNGVADSLLDRQALPSRPTVAGDGLRLGFFGTVSHWFDWALVLRLLDALPTARLEIAGPVETALPKHQRIHHAGVLPHSALASFVTGCDVLVMPFIMNQLVEAVDPVKLYEYVAFGRPALAPRYAESERFAPHIALYRDAAEALGTLEAWAEAAPARTDAQTFLRANTWQQRMAQISGSLASVSLASTSQA